MCQLGGESDVWLCHNLIRARAEFGTRQFHMLNNERVAWELGFYPTHRRSTYPISVTVSPKLHPWIRMGHQAGQEITPTKIRRHMCLWVGTSKSQPHYRLPLSTHSHMPPGAEFSRPWPDTHPGPFSSQPFLDPDSGCRSVVGHE